MVADNTNQQSSDKSTNTGEQTLSAAAILLSDAASKTATTSTANELKNQTETEVQNGNLPNMEISTSPGLTGQESKNAAGDASNTNPRSGLMQDLDGALAVGKDLATGALNEVTEHPLRLAADVAVGAALGTAAVAASPWVGAGLLAGAVGYGAYEVYENAGKWINAAKEVADPTAYTSAQVDQAHSTIQGLGANLTDIAAGTAGGIYGAPLLAPYAASWLGGSADSLAGLPASVLPSSTASDSEAALLAKTLKAPSTVLDDGASDVSSEMYYGGNSSGLPGSGDVETGGPGWWNGRYYNH